MSGLDVQVIHTFENFSNKANYQLVHQVQIYLVMSVPLKQFMSLMISIRITSTLLMETDVNLEFKVLLLKLLIIKFSYFEKEVFKFRKYSHFFNKNSNNRLLLFRSSKKLPINSRVYRHQVNYLNIIHQIYHVILSILHNKYKKYPMMLLKTWESLVSVHKNMIDSLKLFPYIMK